MKDKISKRHFSTAKLLFLLVVFGIFFLGSADLTFAVTKTTLASGLQDPRGIALDESNNRLYFVEYTAGTLKRMDLPPQCGTSSTPLCENTITTVTDIFHPEDVELDLDHGFAYVTTEGTPGTGGLWKVDLSSGAKTLVTFNLGGPKQLVLDTPNNQAYVVSFYQGRLRSIDLNTGAKTTILATLEAPVGLAITSDKKHAYVSDWQAMPMPNMGTLVKIDLLLGASPEFVKSGLLFPAGLAWIDFTQNSLYMMMGDPNDLRVSRIDLSTHAMYDAITGLTGNYKDIELSSNGTPVYVTSGNQIIKVDMVELDLTEPVFLAVGHVPSTSIHDGYATTDPGYFYQVKHSPFGGTLNIFGNLNNFKALGAAYYQVLVSKDGGVPVALDHWWKVYQWNPDPSVEKYELVRVEPVPATTMYKIPDEYPLQAHWWHPPFLFMRWPSGENGLYTFQVKIYRQNQNDITSKLPANKNSLTIRIDNTPPEAEIVSIWQKGSPDKKIEPCNIVSSGNNQYYFKITAFDLNHHLRFYTLKALWGDNRSELLYSDSYANHVDEEGSYWWSGKINFAVPRDVPGSAGNLKTWSADCSCAHTFYLRTGKRTINGYNYILYDDYHKSITINNAGPICP